MRSAFSASFNTAMRNRRRLCRNGSIVIISTQLVLNNTRQPTATNHPRPGCRFPNTNCLLRAAISSIRRAPLTSEGFQDRRRYVATK